MELIGPLFSGVGFASLLAGFWLIGPLFGGVGFALLLMGFCGTLLADRAQGDDRLGEEIRRAYQDERYGSQPSNLRDFGYHRSALVVKYRKRLLTFGAIALCIGVVVMVAVSAIWGDPPQ